MDMPSILKREDWSVRERMITPEGVYWNRRHFFQQMGFLGAGLMAAGLAGCSKQSGEADAVEIGAAVAGTNTAAATMPKGYPAARNAEFNPGWPLTNESTAANYNNYYEFSSAKERVAKLVGKFETSPWPISIGGLVERPMTVDAQELAETMGLEERVYRFRCVEAWAMVVPWTGFPLSKLLEKVGVKAGAKFVKFQSVNRPDQQPGIARLSDFPWPYTEGLRLEEAMNPLAFVATGIYGKPLPKQHGAPLRMVVPWKYGYKGAKSVVNIELVETQPATLWETLSPTEYPFESNVNPKKPHPRWSQATERLIDTGDVVQTQMFNGYAKYVENLYAKA